MVLSICSSTDRISSIFIEHLRLGLQSVSIKLFHLYIYISIKAIVVSFEIFFISVGYNGWFYDAIFIFHRYFSSIIFHSNVSFPFSRPLVSNFKIARCFLHELSFFYFSRTV